MITFWLVIVGLIIGGLSLIWLPYWHKWAEQTIDDGLTPQYQQTQLTYHQQLMMMHNQCWPANLRVLKEYQQELQQCLLVEKQPIPSIMTFSRTNTVLLPVMMSLLFFGGLLVGYGWLGRYQAALNHVETQLTQSSQPDYIYQATEQELKRLLQTLQQDPTNIELLTQLGQFYLYNNQFVQALIIYNRIIELEGANAENLANKALVLYYQNNQKISQEVSYILEQVLRLDSAQITVIMILAADHFHQARYSQAIALWQRLLMSDDPRVDRTTIIESINMAKLVNNSQYIE